jgi:hypothetical protein
MVRENRNRSPHLTINNKEDHISEEKEPRRLYCSEWQLYSQISNLTISNGTLNAISSNAFPALTVFLYSGDDWAILKEDVNTYIS